MGHRRNLLRLARPRLLFDNDGEEGVKTPGSPATVTCAPSRYDGGQIAVRPRWYPGDKRAMTIESPLRAGSSAEQALRFAYGPGETVQRTVISLR